MEAKANMFVMSGGGVEEDRGNNAVTAPAFGHAKQEIEEAEQLLPGIPDEITIDLIAPKLPWTASHILSSVSHAWQRAIQSHQVYDARVRSKSTQTLVALTGRRPSSGLRTVALFSMEDGSWYHLPPIPGLEKGSPWSCQCASLDGKLYVLGGLPDSAIAEEAYACAEVYVFDLAGQRQWKQCASMKDAREEFGCGVKNGKIYVFGGTSFYWPVCGSEVYDPNEDTWSPIAPMPTCHFNHNVTTVGEELFLYNGQVYVSDRLDDDDDAIVNGFVSCLSERARSVQAYHPVQDKWRMVEKSRTSFSGEVVVGRKLDKLHADAWQCPQPYSFAGQKQSDSFTVRPIDAVAVGDEVLAMVSLRNGLEEYNGATNGRCLIRSQGVGDESKETVWRKVDCSLTFYYNCPICPFEL